MFKLVLEKAEEPEVVTELKNIIEGFNSRPDVVEE